MTVPRMFVSYETTDAAFAIQLMSDLRQAGAEIITDSVGLDDPTFEQFLSEQLPLCQYLIVVQTPAALQSPRVRVVVDSALKLVQAGQMAAVVRVLAPDPNGVAAQAVPLRWASTAEIDASQDYARAVAKLHIQLGLSNTQPIPSVAPSASFQPVFGSYDPKGMGNAIPLDQTYPQRSIKMDRPSRSMRPTSPLLSWPVVILLLILVCLLASGLTFVLMGRRTTTPLLTKPVATKPIPTPTQSSVIKGYYFLQNRYSDMVLDDTLWSTLNGKGMIQWGWLNVQNQVWTFVPTGDGYYYIQNHYNSKVLEAAIASTTSKTGTASPGTQSGKASTRTQPSATPGIQIIQWDMKHGQVDQQWKLTPTGDGYYYLQNRYSGLVLDDSGWSTAAGAPIDQWNKGKAQLNQQWLLKPA